MSDATITENRQKSPSGRLSYWDNYKGILILLVITGHVTEWLGSSVPYHQGIWTVIYSFHMPAFALSTGYFIRRSRKHPWSKVPKLFVLYLLMEFLYAICYYFLGSGFHLKLSVPRYGLWYLLFIVYGNLAAPIFLKYRKGYMVPATFVIALIAGCIDGIGRPWGIGQSLYFLPFLTAGMVLDIDRMRDWAAAGKKKAAFCFLAVEGLIFLLLFTPWFSRKFFRGIESYHTLGFSALSGAAGRLLAYVCACILVAAFLGLVPQRRTFLEHFGRYSLIWYLVHTFLLKILDRWLIRLGVRSMPLRLLILLVAVFACGECLIRIRESFVKRESR